ncbi:MAG: hypothetical protein KBT10_09470 [Bacteroidales bacterium]|nr:hypothetical protein [Candidatus Sodaliphilus aphodohippi]
MTRLSLISLLLLALCAVTASCSDDDIGEQYTDYRNDIVTYNGWNGSGNATFTLVGRNDEQSVLLNSDVKPIDGLKAGQRVLLRYNFSDDGNGYDDVRNITAYSLTRIISDTLRHHAGDSPCRTVRLRSLWRTGDYINIHCQVEYTGKERVFALVADDATLHSDTVDCYLRHELRTDTAYHWRECYGSFYVGAIWRGHPERTLRVHLDDNTFPSVKYYDFNKQ